GQPDQALFRSGHHDRQGHTPEGPPRPARRPPEPVGPDVGDDGAYREQRAEKVLVHGPRPVEIDRPKVPFRPSGTTRDQDESRQEDASTKKERHTETSMPRTTQRPAQDQCSADQQPGVEPLDD